MTLSLKDELKLHLQMAIEIELSTIPIYLYTYYSFMRKPEGCDSVSPDFRVQTFANEAGGLIMSVAVEEMLHMSLACNILKSLGGKPKVYGLSPTKFPTNLLDRRKDGFSVGLSELSLDQLSKFLIIEMPEASDAPPEGKDWETLGQFYDYIVDLINQHSDYDFQDGADFQLADGKGYYSSSNVDTIYPDNAKVFTEKIQSNPIQPLEASAQYANQDDSGKLMVINSKAAALKAITIIKDQGEGNNASHKPDDPSDKEDSHWFKYNKLLGQGATITEDQWKCFLFGFPDNPTRAKYLKAHKEYVCVIDLVNAVYSYLLLITEVSYNLSGKAQQTMFYIGMHKGMIFILDKLIGNMRYTTNNPGKLLLAPTFENYAFKSITTAKKELLSLCDEVNTKYPKICDTGIAQRIHDLPDVNVQYTPGGAAMVSFA